jgi:prophage tail gpP-like protein
MADREIVTLTVNGQDYAGWMDVDIGAGVLRLARDFTLTVTWDWPGNEGGEVRIRQGDRCEVRIDGELVLTGYVFGTPVRHDAKSLSLSIKGRSLTADLVDCCPDDKPGQWRNQTIENIARALVKPYGITVVNEAGDRTMVKDHTVKPGETVFESLDQLLTLSRLLAMDDGRGRMVMVRPGSAGRAHDRLARGENILTGESELGTSPTCSRNTWPRGSSREAMTTMMKRTAHRWQPRLWIPVISRHRRLVIRGRTDYQGTGPMAGRLGARESDQPCARSHLYRARLASVQWHIVAAEYGGASGRPDYRL